MEIFSVVATAAGQRSTKNYFSVGNFLKRSQLTLSCQKGVSLIEVLVGIVLIAVVSLAALSYFAHGMGGIAKQGNRRAALERARERLEQLMAANIGQLEPPIDGLLDPDDQPVYWISCDNGICTRTTEYVADTASVNERPNQRVESIVRWRDDPSVDTSDPDTLELAVKVWFTSRENVDDDFNRVYVKTLRTP